MKGERLKYYPTGMPLFSASREMKRPVVEKISNKEAMERVENCKMVYRETYVIGDEKKLLKELLMKAIIQSQILSQKAVILCLDYHIFSLLSIANGMRVRLDTVKSLHRLK
jgi:hypothetical protein